MGDIAVPPSLSNANATLGIAESMAKLLDPKERQKISDDIKSFHALNETEAKKAADARALIKEHSGILEQTLQSEQKTIKMQKQIDIDRAALNAEKAAEWEKINAANNDLKEKNEEAQKLHDQAVDLTNKANQKEADLAKARIEHEVNVKKLADDRASLEKEQKKLEDFRKQVMELDAQTKAKVESLKKFNF